MSLFGGEEFQCDLARCQPIESELAYLYYDSGGFYRQHFDTPGHRIFREDEDDYGHRRAFSFILFLNADWDPADGGQLVLSQQISVEEQRRRSSEEADGRGTWIEDEEQTSVDPESGTLGRSVR